MKSTIFDYKNMHLGLSSMALCTVGLAYGISPNAILPIFFDFKVESVDLHNVFRALMGLYFGFAAYFLYGILNPEYWRSATLVSVIFMGGIAVGRIISILFDGVPSLSFVIGTLLEVAFTFWGILNLGKRG